MQFYTFLETSLVMLALLPHFIAFFSDEEIPGTPGTLATTFLAFGMGCLDYSSDQFNFSDYVLMYDMFSCHSFESGICIECLGVFDHAHIISGC